MTETEELRVKLAAAERRAEEALAEQTRHLLLTTAADLKAQKAEAQSAAGRVAIRMLMEDHDPHTYSRCEDRACDHVRLAISALAADAGRALLDRLHAAEAKVARMDARKAVRCGKCAACPGWVNDCNGLPNVKCPDCHGSGAVIVEGGE